MQEYANKKKRQITDVCSREQIDHRIHGHYCLASASVRRSIIHRCKDQYDRPTFASSLCPSLCNSASLAKPSALIPYSRGNAKENQGIPPHAITSSSQLRAKSSISFLENPIPPVLWRAIPGLILETNFR